MSKIKFGLGRYAAINQILREMEEVLDTTKERGLKRFALMFVCSVGLGIASVLLPLYAALKEAVVGFLVGLLVIVGAWLVFFYTNTRKEA